MKWLLITLMAVLVGCGTRVPDVRTVRVGVPVLVTCKTQAVAVPIWAVSQVKKADSLEKKVRALLAERRQRMGYERELVAVVGACQ